METNSHQTPQPGPQETPGLTPITILPTSGNSGRPEVEVTILPVSGVDVEAELRIIRLFATVMDEMITVPGTKLKFGLDPILGFIPVLGDLGSAAVSAYLLRAASRLGVPAIVQLRMLTNISVDTALGLVPFAGDYLDIMFKANKRNANLILQAVENRKTVGRTSWFMFISVFLAFILIVVGGFIGTVMLAKWAWTLTG